MRILPIGSRLPMSRAMSSSTLQRYRFIVYALDMTDEGALQRRLSVRPAHLERAREEIAKGVISTSPRSVAARSASRAQDGMLPG